ncbi:ATP-dependent Clp protease ATP-binding subunit [bacterium]|nr:ATP-dependent Clp protease ATP-binding subunit [bacterium]
MNLFQEYRFSDQMIIPRPSEARYILSILNRQGVRRRIVLVGERGCGKRSLIEEVLRALTGVDLGGALHELKPLFVSRTALLHQIHTLSDNSERAGIPGNALIIIEDMAPLLQTYNDSAGHNAKRQAMIDYLFAGSHALIGTVRTIEYQRFMVSDSFWQENLIPFIVQEMPLGNIRRILTHWQAVYHKQYQVTIPDRIIDEIMDLGLTLLKNHAFPQSGIELIEAVASSAVIRASLAGGNEVGPLIVQSDDLYEQLSHLLRIPVGNYLGIEENRIFKLKELLSREIFGQERALTDLVKAVQRALLGTREPGHAHPLGIFLFMGPTGVGKTETARALSKHLFGQDQSILMNMPEMQDPVDGIKRLRGAALAHRISDNPFSVIILDEIEKAPQRIREFFLNIFDTGLLKDIDERTIDASNAFFIMTSNVGSDLFEQSHGILPETFSDQDYLIKKSELLEALKKEQFRPEFINRIDEIVLFRPLLRSDIIKIIDSNLQSYTQLIQENEDKKVDYDFGITEVLAKGCDLNFGARDARRVLRRNIYSHLLRTDQYYQAKKIEIMRSELLRSLDQIHVVVVSKSEKDGISLILNLNKSRFNLEYTRFEDVKDFLNALPTLRFDIVLFHTNITQEGTKHSTLGLGLNSLKKMDHRASIFIVVDSFQSLNMYKPYMSQGVRGLLRVAELESWLTGFIAEVRQRKSITQLVEFNFENLVWKQIYDEQKQTLFLILESYGQLKK